MRRPWKHLGEMTADAVSVHSARDELDPLLERFAAAPLDDPAAVAGLQRWMQERYPTAREAFVRLRDGLASPGAGDLPPAPPDFDLRVVRPPHTPEEPT